MAKKVFEIEFPNGISFNAIDIEIMFSERFYSNITVKELPAKSKGSGSWSGSWPRSWSGSKIEPIDLSDGHFGLALLKIEKKFNEIIVHINGGE